MHRYGPERDDGDGHNPANMDPIVEKYEQFEQRVEVTDGMDRNGISPVHYYFPEFIESLALLRQ